MTMIIQWCNENQGFLSAVLSLVAVLAAVGIPAFIAHRQNKITLFEKRYEVVRYIDKIILFADSLTDESCIDEKLGRIPQITLWIMQQRLDLCFPESISYIPDAIKKEPEKGVPLSEAEMIIQDTDLMRKQLTEDAFVLTQGCTLFPEPIRSEIEYLKCVYAAYLLKLITKYRNIEPETDFSQEQVQFLAQCKKFGRKTNLTKKIIKKVVL